MPNCEVWLRGNRRALLIGAFVPAVLGTLGLVGGLDLFPFPFSVALRLAAGILALLAILVGIAMLNQARLPRLAYAKRELLVYAGTSRPIRIPIEVVEVFFGGQGETEVQIPGEQVQARNIVIRLAERAKQWHHRDLRSSFGRWADGYVSIKGAWCEPITMDLIQSLNHKLVLVKREIRQEAELALKEPSTASAGIECDDAECDNKEAGE